MTQWEINRAYNDSLDCLEGKGVPEDLRKSFALNAKAAHGGHGEAVLAMGWYYLGGVGVGRDLVLARKWYRESARRGEPRAMFSLGRIALEEQDFSEAFTWFRRAVDHGHARSLYWLGRHYWKGKGVAQDKKRAMALFHQAAGKKVKEAQRVLGSLK